MNAVSYFIKTLFRMLTVLIDRLMFLKGAPVTIEHLYYEEETSWYA